MDTTCQIRKHILDSFFVKSEDPNLRLLMDTMTEHWGHLIGRTLEPPAEEGNGASPAAPVADDGDGGSTNLEGDGSPALGHGDGEGNLGGDSAPPTSGDGASTSGESDGNLSAAFSSTPTLGDGASSNGDGDGKSAHALSVPPTGPTSGGAPSLPSTVAEMENERDSIMILRLCLNMICLFQFFPCLHHVM